MAKTYVEIHPEHRVLVVDKAASVGGSWSQERLYPRLKTNNVLGSYELSDYPMRPERYEAKPGGHIPGHVVHKYFVDVAENYGIDSSRLQLCTTVQAAAQQDDGRWLIELRTEEPDSEPRRCFVAASKIVVATGLTSQPNIPTFTGQESFGGLMLHSKQLKASATELRACKNVVVLGGNKSAWDVCYDAARSGAQVHMVIRPSGGGPSYVWPKTFKYGPKTLALAPMSATRFFMAFDPTFHANKGPFSQWSRFLHHTSLGNKLCHSFWTRLDRHIRKINGYDSHPELKKLEPWTTPFWMGNSLSIHNYETNWFDIVREGKIKVHIAEIDSLSSGKVHLSDGSDIVADALVCCTGWKSISSIQFQEDGLSSVSEIAKEINLDMSRSEAEIGRQSKLLKKTPKRTPNAPKLSTQGNTSQSSLPTSLYRYMVPWQADALDSHNLAFIGCHSSIHAVVVAQAQALWITAYFDQKLKQLSCRETDYDAARYDAILHGMYGAVRRPKECGGAADKHPDLVFDSVAYVDCLLGDIGVSSRRKRGLWKEMFESYGPKDYKGIVEEWKKAQEEREKV
jgi:hypothetical protein